MTLSTFQQAKMIVSSNLSITQAEDVRHIELFNNQFVAFIVTSPSHGVQLNLKIFKVIQTLLYEYCEAHEGL